MVETWSWIQWSYLSIWYMMLTSNTVFLAELARMDKMSFGWLALSNTIFFVISGLPSPCRELYSVGFMLPLLCDLLYIHIICTVSAFQPNVLSMLYCVYTSNSPQHFRVNSTTFLSDQFFLYSWKLTLVSPLLISRFSVSFFSFSLFFLLDIAGTTRTRQLFPLE